MGITSAMTLGYDTRYCNATAVACAATGLVGKESELFRFTVKHSLLFAAIVGVITMIQAYWLTGMIPG